MAAFLKDISFHGVLLDGLLGPSSIHVSSVRNLKLKVTQLVLNGIDSGAVKPLKRSVFSKDKAEDAFRFMASGKHIGKVVLKIRDEEDQKIIVPQ